MARLDEGRSLREPAVKQLPDGHPAGPFIDDRAEVLHERGHVGLIAVANVALPGPESSSPDPPRIGSEQLVLEEDVEDVESEAVDAAVQPRPDDVEQRSSDLRVPPVEVGLLREERVHVELLPGLVPGPGGTTEEGPPVVRRPPTAEERSPGRIAPDVPVRERPVAARARRLEPRVAMTAVVQDEVHDDPDPTAVGGFDEPIEIRERPVLRVDAHVVGHVVPEVEVR